MIVKILDSASSDFHGVKYNDKKIDKGSGELLEMKNFTSFINEESKQDEVRDYLKSISKNGKVKNPQFHAVISSKFQEHSKEELKEIAEEFMKEMGYENQPYIVVFHNDTENNHVHIVSTRVDKNTGKKLDDSYEKLKSQRALSKVMEKLHQLNQDEKLEKLLNYQYGSLQQLKLLLERHGFKMKESLTNENELDILKNGVKLKTVTGTHLQFSPSGKDARSYQLKAILNKYKDIFSTKVFSVEDDREWKGLYDKNNLPKKKPKVEFESELQKKMKDMFGIDIVFHQNENKKPFGYSVIDNKTGKIYKGSDIMKMNELFEFTEEKLDKKTFEILKDFKIDNQDSKDVLLQHLKTKFPEQDIKSFMLFENKARIKIEDYKKVQQEVRDFLKQNSGELKNENIRILKTEEGKYFAVHDRFHVVAELEKLVGTKDFNQYLIFESGGSSNFGNPNSTEKIFEKQSNVTKAMNELVFELQKTTGNSKDPAEAELKKRRRKKR